MTNPLKQKIAPRVKLDGFTDEEKEEILGMLENIIKEKIFIRVLDEFSEEEKSELQKMSEGEYGALLNSFLEPRLPQFKKIIESCLDEVVGEFNAMRV